MTSYKELLAWQVARKLKDLVYRAVLQLPKNEEYALSSQMRRAVVSIGSNIAEGQGRGTINDYIHFLYIARGSAYELESQIIYCDDLHFLTQELSTELHDQIRYDVYLINRLISALKRMLMYGKEASNRKQEIDRQHYTIPNQRPKDKHCGKI